MQKLQHAHADNQTDDRGEQPSNRGRRVCPCGVGSFRCEMAVVRAGVPAGPCTIVNSLRTQTKLGNTFGDK